MQGDYWNDFTKSGKVSDYLKYVDSAKNTSDGRRDYMGGSKEFDRMESRQDAGKSDRNGAFGHSGW